MERGGFHGYRRVPPQPTSSGMNMKPENNNNNNHHIMITGNNNNNHHSAAATAAADDECTVREQDRFMPIANVIRIMRKILPAHAKISDDAKETIQECVSEFISFITGEANERCQREQRKTITAEDVLWAMSKLGFDDYIEPLTLYLNRYREFEGDRGSLRGEPLVKRAVEIGTTSSGGVHGYPPPPPYQFLHQHGFYGAPSAAIGGFLRDGPMTGGSPAQVPAANGGAAAMTTLHDPYGQCDK